MKNYTYQYRITRNKLARILKHLRKADRNGYYFKPDLKTARRMEQYLGLRR